MRRSAAVLVVVALAAACSGGDGEGARPTGSTRPLTPTFPPTSLGGGPPPTTAPSPTTTAGPGGPPTTAPPGGAPAPTTTPAPEVTTTGRITDRVGDATISADPAPRYADLAGGVLTRTGDRVELRVRLGTDAPAAGDPDHTMNVASFYDVEGDGRVDFEVWANLSDTGWDGSWFDDRGRGAAAFGARSGVTVAVEGGDLVLRFGADRLGGADRFQWSLASEWGRYEVIGTVAAARDDAPDDDGAVAFPQAS